MLRPVGGLLPKVILESGAELRQSDLGLDTVIEDIPNTSSGLPIDINSMTVGLAGTAGTPPQGFIRNPTSCVAKAATVTATSYADPDTPVNATAPSFTPTGCDQVPFSPEFSALIGAPGATASGTKPPMTTLIEQTIEEAGLKRARVMLPSNIGSDPNLLTVDLPRGQLPGRHLPAQHDRRRGARRVAPAGRAAGGAGRGGRGHTPFPSWAWT